MSSERAIVEGRWNDRGAHYWKTPAERAPLPSWMDQRHPEFDHLRFETDLRLPDYRHMLKKRPEDKPGLTPRILERQRARILESRLSNARKRYWTALWRLIDCPTRLCFTARDQVQKIAEVSERKAYQYLAELVEAGAVLRPDDHHYNLHSPELVEHTAAWDSGIQLLECGILTDDDLERAIKRVLLTGRANDTGQALRRGTGFDRNRSLSQ